eukprot:tig00000157_g9668.t1
MRVVPTSAAVDVQLQGPAVAAALPAGEQPAKLGSDRILEAAPVPEKQRSRSPPRTIHVLAAEDLNNEPELISAIVPSVPDAVPTCKASEPSEEPAAQHDVEVLLDKFWAAIVRGTVKSAARVPAVNFERYSAFHLALFRALRSKWTRAEAVSLAQADWLSDSVRDGSGQSVVTRRHVQTSLVNLALWWGTPEGGAGELGECAPAAEPAARGVWCRDFLSVLLKCIARRDAASGAYTVAPFEEVDVGCCVRAAVRLRKASASPRGGSSDGSDGESSDASSSASSGLRDPAWSEAVARALLSSLERPDVVVGDDRRRLWDRTHLRRHVLANRLRGRLESGDLDAYVVGFDFQI